MASARRSARLLDMAKSKDTNKAPGRWAQIFRLFGETIKVDKLSLPLTALVSLSALAAGLLLAVYASDNVLSTIIYAALGLLASVMLGLLVMSRRAEAVAYGRIDGQAGAVGAVVSSAIKRGWRTSEVPVAVNPRTRDAIYRCVGAAGVVLIAEGSRNGTKMILDEEVRKLKRSTPGVQIHIFYVTGDDTGTPLGKLAREIMRLKRSLNRSEVSAVNARLQALGMNLPIPKGIDPKKMRASRR
ncbi:MAG: DUF4191 family protein [Microbacteriaceae bacterium]|nr:DUF4191 family protein [Microbacteriaceae bacterium]